MFSKSLFVFFFAVGLIQPNEAIFGIDTAIKSLTVSLIKESNNVIQSASAQVLFLLISLQTAVQSATNSLNTQIVEVVNAGIVAGVSAAGGSQARISNCTRDNQAAVTAFEISALNKIINNCITNDLTQTINIISTISGAANTVTNIVSNVNSTIESTCPSPASGDIIGDLIKGLCALGTKKYLKLQVAYEGVVVIMAGFQASALITSLGAFTAVIPTCVTTQLGNTAFEALPVIAPIIQCTLF